MIPHIIVFKDSDFQGPHMHIFDSMPSLPEEFNNTISSFVVLSGRWEMCDEENYEKPFELEFGVGRYSLTQEMDRAALKKLGETDPDNVSDEIKELLAQPAENAGDKAKMNDKISSIKLVGMW